MGLDLTWVTVQLETYYMTKIACVHGWFYHVNQVVNNSTLIYRFYEELKQH